MKTMENRNNYDVMNLFHEKKFIKVCAPMVRYSKYQFRTLVKEYGCDLCFTPMILSDSFCRSQAARDNEFVTNPVDEPLIIQFAANNVNDFVSAAYMASPYCNGADLNCGCPQRWARNLGIGCAMLDKPELIYDIVRQTRNQILKPFTMSVKIRIFPNIRKTVSICQQLEHCGVSFLTVHGRTNQQKPENSDVNTEAIRIVNDSVNCPVIANGGVKTLDDVLKLQEETNCKGVMVANGILTNPALFSGVNETPMDCVQKWLNICFNSVPDLNLKENEIVDPTILIPHKSCALTFQCFHHHLVFMLEKILNKKQKRIFNNKKSFPTVLKFLDDNLNLRPMGLSEEKQFHYRPISINYENRSMKYLELSTKNLNSESNKSIYDYDASDGKFFKSKIGNENDTCISDLFVEV